MDELYRTTPTVFRPGAPSVVAIHCSDPRYLPHFREFLEKGLGIARYAVIAVPGGAQCLTPSDALPKFPWVGWRWTKFMVKLMAAERVVIIGHDDCQWNATQNPGLDTAALRQRKQTDLRLAKQLLEERFHKTAVELYFATLDGDAAVFETL